jgi:hypothetical protein
VKFTLWDFMHVFGPDLMVGNDTPIEGSKLTLSLD